MMSGLLLWNEASFHLNVFFFAILKRPDITAINAEPPTPISAACTVTSNDKNHFIDIPHLKYFCNNLLNGDAVIFYLSIYVIDFIVNFNRKTY